jgi:type IV pilus assembly protein PilC
MILAGESSGSLPTILVRLAEYYDTRDKFTKKVKSALAYPIFVIAFVVIILIVMMTLIIPRFQAIFETMGGKIPPFTQGFMNVYDILTANITYVSVGTLIFAFLIFAYSRTRSGHYRLSAIFLSVPLLGTLISQAFVATFCKTMSTLLSAGVSVVEAFDILSEMSSNELIKNAVFDSKQGVIEGANLSSAMARTGFFPNMVSRMVEVGEKSGSLPKVFDRSSHYYETKMDATITTLLSCLGPIVIVLVGGIVMVVIIALYLPIFSMSDFNT